MRPRRSTRPTRWGRPTLAIDLLPLTSTALERLATAQLGGAPSPGLLDELAVRSDGLPGRALATIDAWCRAGEVAATSQGLSLVPPHDPSQNGTEHSTLLVRAMEQTSARDQHVLHLVAILDRPVSPALLTPLLRAPGLAPDETFTDDVATVVASLDHLVDLQLLASTPEGYLVRDPFLRHAVESWLRPSVRRRLHAHVAERARIPAAERGRHWRAAGEVELATAAAIDAVRDAMAVGDVSAARLQLLVVNDLAAGTHGRAAPTWPSSRSRWPTCASRQVGSTRRCSTTVARPSWLDDTSVARGGSAAGQGRPSAAHTGWGRVGERSRTPSRHRPTR